MSCARATVARVGPNRCERRDAEVSPWSVALLGWLLANAVFALWCLAVYVVREARARRRWARGVRRMVQAAESFANRSDVGTPDPRVRLRAPSTAWG